MGVQDCPQDCPLWVALDGELIGARMARVLFDRWVHVVAGEGEGNP